ncbi:MAG: hypothetical protein AB7P67_09625, partial [Vicinamibacterales bacterium]
MTESRRAFLKLFGAGLTAATWPADAGASETSGSAAAARPVPFGTAFMPVRPGREDALRLPPGFTWDVVAAWGDRLPGTDRRFGFNADYTAFLP